MINQRLFDWYGIDTNKNLALKTFCPRPFDTILIDKNGTCFACECTAWLPQSVGNLHLQSLKDIINSPMSKHLQNSIIDGSYRYCNEKNCSYILAQETQEYHFKKRIPESKNKTLRLAIDDSCNLQCPSCRNKKIFEKSGSKFNSRIRLADKIIDYISGSKDTIDVHVGSDGDPFASLIYRYFIRKTKNFDNIKYSIQTNGLLIKKMYDKNKTMFDKLKVLNLSIDGASAATYENLRLGGKFENIIDNLEFITKISKKNFLLILHVVLQKKNFKEIFTFIDMAKKYNFDRIYFNKIQNWNTNLNYAEENIFDPSHRNHKELESYINEIMKIRNTYPKKFIEGTAIPY